MDKQIILVGDLHGYYERLFDNLDRYKITNAILICVGDIGIGFCRPDVQREKLGKLNERFKKRGISFIGIRGNHDDPAYFKGNIKLSNLELLPDYTYREINGKTFLFVGGATSIDRQYRTLGQDYWLDEIFVLKPELVKPCDVLIAHTAPYWLGPFDKEGISGWCLKDPTLWEECKKERLEMAELIKLCGAKRAYFGHFHVTTWVDFQDCLGRILDIDEIAEYKD